MVTHNLRRAQRLADYVLFFYLGELVEHGPARRLFDERQDGRTAGYLRGEF